MAPMYWFLKVIVQRVIGEKGDKGLSIKVHKDAKLIKDAGEGFRMPLHYPRYKEEDYERMKEWKLDVLLKEYGLSCEGSHQEKRAYTIGSFLWPHQL